MLQTPHGSIRGPFFMPSATRGAVKHVAPDELRQLGAEVILANTYHLALQPGAECVAAAGGLHRFMGWDGPILTDSGGFQIFSLARYRHVTDAGVRFRDPRSGRLVRLTPCGALVLQRQLGSDIMMVLDECVGYPASQAAAELAVVRTSAWALASRRAYARWMDARLRPLLFGIIQGATFSDLRERSCRELTALDFDGYAIGGLAVGEPRQQMYRILRQVVSRLPRERPRYLMGVGRPEEIVAAVRYGVDLFDCVIPTREARHGRLYVWRGQSRGAAAFGRNKFYDTVAITNARFKRRHRPIDAHCRCSTCERFTAAYLHHLFRLGEPLGLRLATIHNLRFYLDLMAVIRSAIRQGKF